MRAAGTYAAGGQRYVSPWSGSLRWLLVPAIRDELELVDEQIADVEKIRKDLQQEQSGLYRGMKDLSPQERQQKYREKYAELAEMVEKRVKKALLPEQMDRLNQISLQMRLRSYVGNALTGDDLVEALKITDDQKEELQKVHQQVQKELQAKNRELYAKLQEEMKKLRAEAQQKVLTVLTKRQRDKLEEMQGKKWEMPPWKPVQRKPQ
jgi:hypothetical protein